jgi:hypothetical protein
MVFLCTYVQMRQKRSYCSPADEAFGVCLRPNALPIRAPMLFGEGCEVSHLHNVWSNNIQTIGRAQFPTVDQWPRLIISFREFRPAHLGSMPVQLPFAFQTPALV